MPARCRHNLRDPHKLNDPHDPYVYDPDHTHQYRRPSSHEHPRRTTHSTDREFRTKPQERRDLRLQPIQRESQSWIARRSARYSFPQQFFSGTQFRSLADQRGFLILYGSAANDMNCWDVTSNTSLTHDAGGDSLGLASAIRYAITEWGVNPSMVFSTGFSSGAMMTNVMAGAYPDLVKAGAAFAGVPMGCKLQSNGPVFPPDACAAGQLSKTPQEWGEMAKKGYPGYTGAYPRMQLWHGTADNALDFRNLAEEVKQWTFMHGVSQTATQTQAGFPKSNWAKSVYGNGEVQSYVGSGNGHLLPEAGTEVVAIDFFGL